MFFMVSILDEVFGMRLTLFISILSCLILLPCWLVMNHLKPPLNFISPGTTQRAAVGFVISIIIKFIANDKLTDDGHVAAIITGTLLTAASPVFIIGIGFNHLLSLSRMNPEHVRKCCSRNLPLKNRNNVALDGSNPNLKKRL